MLLLLGAPALYINYTCLIWACVKKSKEIKRKKTLYSFIYIYIYIKYSRFFYSNFGRPREEGKGGDKSDGLLLMFIGSRAGAASSAAVYIRLCACKRCSYNRLAQTALSSRTYTILYTESQRSVRVLCVSDNLGIVWLLQQQSTARLPSGWKPNGKKKKKPHRHSSKRVCFFFSRFSSFGGFWAGKNSNLKFKKKSESVASTHTHQIGKGGKK